jgi:hypothetical protein
VGYRKTEETIKTPSHLVDLKVEGISAEGVPDSETSYLRMV